jgi:hypothetical protein
VAAGFFAAGVAFFAGDDLPGLLRDNLLALISFAQCHRELHGLLQFLRRPERNLLAGLDLDRLTGRWIPTHPRRSRPDLEDTQASQPDFVTPLEMAGRERHEITQHCLSPFLREVMAVSQRGGEMRSPTRTVAVAIRRSQSRERIVEISGQFQS